MLNVKFIGSIEKKFSDYTQNAEIVNYVHILD